MAMIFGLRGRESDKKRGDDNIPISISRAFDSKINFPFHRSGTIGGSADGYVAVFDNVNTRSSCLHNNTNRSLYITNILTGESVTLPTDRYLTQLYFGKRNFYFSPYGMIVC